MPYGTLEFVLIQQKTSNAKKRNILLHGTLIDWTKFTTQNNEKKKRKPRFF
jgi:hypothetical protein